MKTRFTLSALISALAVAGSASALIPQEVFTEADANNGELASPFLDAVTVSGGIAYAFSRDTSSSDVGAVTAFDGVSFTTVMTSAQWATTGSTSDMAASNGVGIVGGKARFISFFDNNVYEVDLGTGTPTEVVSAAAINAVTGVSSNLSVASETGSDGTIYGYDFQSDSIVSISPTNVVTVEATQAQLGGTTNVGGIAIAGDTILIGDNTSDSLLAWNTVTDTLSTVLPEATIDALASTAADTNDGNVGFGDIFAGPDGLVYFYENDGDDLFVYDPADPAGTLEVLVSEADFAAGPSGDVIAQLSWWDGNIAYTDQSDGFYVVPEPTSLALLGLGGLLIARRRRA